MLYLFILHLSKYNVVKMSYHKYSPVKLEGWIPYHVCPFKRMLIKE